MKQEEVFAKVRTLVAKQLSISESEVTAEASFLDDLGADSLDQVELIMSFEEEFDIEIPEDEADKIRKVQDVLNFIEERLN